jgi:TRAP transporter TAXI family solute receptor
MEREERKVQRHRRGPWAAALFAVLILQQSIATAPPALAEQAPRFFRIGTAATTGTYFVIGAEIANAISKPPGARDCGHGGSCGVDGLVAVAQATQGSIENVLAMGSGQLEAALVQADIAKWAYTGKVPALKACRGATPLPANGTALLTKVGAIGSLRAIAALYPEAIHVVARSDAKVKSLGDLKGKRVAMGEPGSGTLAEARLVLDAADVAECQVKALYPRLSEAASLLEKNNLDVFFMIGGYPVPAITEAASMEPVRLLSVSGAVRDKLIKQYPFVAATIPGATYPGIDAETQTVAVPALFVVSAFVTDELAYGITKALWQDATRHLLDNGHPAGKNIRIENALKGVSIPLHPGAARYYQELGLMKAAN